jgi:hypothetical protein
MSNTLESARLYNEAQQRAAREQAIGEITTNITAATEVDDIIRETVTQLGKRSRMRTLHCASNRNGTDFRIGSCLIQIQLSR